MPPRLSVTPALSLVTWLLLATRPCSASITMTDSGQRFRSVVDPHLGKPLWTGYDYYARLQTLPHDRVLPTSNTSTVSNLCEPPDVLNLTIPSDGLPVALLVQGGGCSVQQKINIALQYIQPAPLLRFLIINDIDHHLRPPGEEAFTNAKAGNEDEESYARSMTAVNYSPETDAAPSNPPSTPYDDPPEKIIPLHIIHITNPVYEQLLNVYLLPESQAATRAAGGPRVTIDSTSGDGYYGLIDNKTALWISIFAICSACACTILILVGNSMNQHNHDWEEWNRQQQLQQQQQRRQRRRLTREQIRRLLPQYRYDGTQLNLVHNHYHDVDKSPLDDEHSHLQDALLAPSSTLSAPPTTLAMPLELDCCSVCLDDYEVGDKIRILPCNHCFHSRCVGRWLAERSATCPLCKTELWPEEEEEEEDDEHAGDEEAREAANLRPGVEEDSFWNRLFFGSNTLPTAAAGPATEQEMTELQARQDAEAGEPAEQGLGVARAVRNSWFRRMFPSHGPWGRQTDEETETTNMLTEPLLVDEEIGQGGMAVENEGESHPVSPESPEQQQRATHEAPVSAEANQVVDEAEEEQNTHTASEESPVSAFFEPTESPPRQVSV